MSERVQITVQTVPRLPRHAKLRHDKERDRWVVVAPERLFVADEIALEIIRRCDGVGAIADQLAAKYEAPREVILKDVSDMLQDHADKGV